MTSVPPVLDELIASLEDQLTKTEDKLRDARAQIAAKDAEIAHLDKVLRQVGSTGMDPTKADELEKARAG